MQGSNQLSRPSSPFNIAGPNKRGSTMQHSTVHITAAQLTTLNSAPVATNVPQPGTGRIVVFIGANLQLEGGPSNGEVIRPFIRYTADASGIIAGFIVGAGISVPASLQTHPVSLISGGGSSAGFDPTNKSLELTAGADLGIFGPVTAVAVTAGHGGTGYAIGDLFNISGGDSNAVGRVTAVAAGAVTGVAITGAGTNTGTNYQTAAGAATTVNTGAGDGTLQVDITVSTPGTGDAQLDIWYDVVQALAG